jgi:hypothetical protein
MHATETTPVNGTPPELKAFWVFIANICALDLALHQRTILDRMIHAHTCTQRNGQLYVHPKTFFFLEKEPAPTRTLANFSNTELEHGVVPFKVSS